MDSPSPHPPGLLQQSQAASLTVLLSIDLLPNILTFLAPPQSVQHQAWLASLALVHPSWRGPVSFVLRQHPIVTSVDRLLQFQDSLWELSNPDARNHTHDFGSSFRQQVPLANAIHTLLIDFRPNALSFLLKVTSSSLHTIGVHEVYFCSPTVSSKSDVISAVFDSIFSLPNLITLNLSGALAGIDGVWRFLGAPWTHSNFIKSEKDYRQSNANQEDVQLTKRSNLHHLILSDSACTPCLYISPSDLMTRWNSHTSPGQDKADDHVSCPSCSPFRFESTSHRRVSV
ncbi:hypothetical protein CROQUDRAFT_45111 [Cronartium quercuum f. sp. fusiforme G11]|uniref:Uncharacterized protein n=1 Tax=Cronartium quercuum f. sp. fusiforme G11 TaxID=708437 RepID=A0A9P6NKQ2_9BASI|nr:hypothetical protein CROQUDRAFT_45111 [Cronartium quercuum f. sp. fusiforme G11]